VRHRGAPSVLGAARRGAALLWMLGAATACGAVPSGPGTGDAAAGPAATVFAPYFYTWGWGSPAYAFGSLMEMKSRGGPSAVTLAFVTSAGGCHATTDIEEHRADLQAYVVAGGHAIASFGGATGTYLENACASAGELAGEHRRFVDATGITELDFDLEQHGASSNPAVNLLRATALKQLQGARPVRVSFTLPVAPGGLLQESIDILQAAVTAGVTISVVNGMTMDYGDGTDLATTPIRSIEGLAIQLRSVMPGLGREESYRMAGATAMIGKNDDNETFSLDNARTLLAYARQHQLGLVSFWAIQRDQACPVSADLAVCSRVNATTFEFSNIFASVTDPAR